MTYALTRLPDPQLEPLRRAYAEAVAAKRRQMLLGGAILIVAIAISGWTAEVRLDTLFKNIGDFFNYFIRLFIFDGGPQSGSPAWTDFGEWFWGLPDWLSLLLDTILIAYLATLTGSVGAFFACFLAAKNLGPNPVLRGIIKRFLELCRTVPEIVFALIFVVAFGLGPLPGVLAIAIHTIGANGKLFTEVVENIDMKPVEGAIASGGTWAESIRFAVLPQVLSSFASYALLRFEINVRGASVMGFVGAGGIGQDLIEAIRKFYYTDVSAILLLIMVTVFLIDTGTQQLRHYLLGRDESMSDGIRNAALADIAGLRARHPSVFYPGLGGRAIGLGVIAVVVGLLVLAVIRLDVSLTRIIAGMGELGRIVGHMFPPVPHSWPQATLYLHALAETVAIAFLGTLCGALLAVPLALLAAHNTTINRVIQFFARRSSDTVRSIDQLIWALIWVNVVGLGPFAGMLAVMTSDIGNLSKLFSEALETADRKPVEGVVSTGGTRTLAIRFGIMPQVLPVLASQTLYFFESNTRSSTIIGIVGAGGIGLHLAEQIRTLEFQSVAFIILLILGAVMAIDYVSGILRQAITGRVQLTH